MSVGKIFGLGIVGIVLLLMVYVMTQSTSVNNTQEEKMSDSVATEHVKAQAAPKKSEEEQKLEELREQTKELSYARTSKLYASKCSACHGRAGEGRVLGPAGTKLAPPIGGKSEAFILDKLKDYRQDRVPNTLMKGLLTNSTDEELNTLAKEISSFK